MLSKSDNIEITINDKGDEVIQELFESILSRYQTGLEESMKESDFVFDYIDFFILHLNGYIVTGD